MGASGALEALVKLLPADAHRLRPDGGIDEVPVSAIKPGDRVLVKPGEKVPTDGVVIEGGSSLNESMLTGESRPVTRGPGDQVIGGSINGEGALTLEIRKTGNETYLAQVIELVRQAQASRSRTQDLANRAAQWLTYIALSVGGLTLLAWLVLGQGFEFALAHGHGDGHHPPPCARARRALVAVSTSSRRRAACWCGPAAFERAQPASGGVTRLGRSRRAASASPMSYRWAADEAEVLRLAASLESQSEHPIARGIVEVARGRGLNVAPVKDFRNLTGRGPRRWWTASPSRW
jgi:Cu2+-exporting ATPase